MRASFVETEVSERAFFAAELSELDLHFCDELSEVPADVEILSTFIAFPVDANFLAAHPRLRFVASRSTSFDHVDLATCEERGIQVVAVGSYGDHTVAEHTFALILALSRRLRAAMHADSGRRFSYEALRGFELHGKTLGVVGAGRIGRQTLPTDPISDPAVAAEIGFRYVELDELLRQSHIISLNVPLTSETLHLFNRETFAKCRPGVFLINTARGRLIEGDALLQALQSGIVGGAGLDVLEDERVMRTDASQILVNQITQHVRESIPPAEPLREDAGRVQEVQQLMQNSELLAHANVVFTPHIAFNSVEAIGRIHRATVENIRAFLAGTPPAVH